MIYKSDLLVIRKVIASCDGVLRRDCGEALIHPVGRAFTITGPRGQLLSRAFGNAIAGFVRRELEHRLATAPNMQHDRRLRKPCHGYMGYRPMVMTPAFGFRRKM